MTPEIEAAIKRSQPAALQVAQPMNDVQNIALVAGQLYHAASRNNSADQLLDLATEIVAGAYIRVASGRFQRALDIAKEQAQKELAKDLAPA